MADAHILRRGGKDVAGAGIRLKVNHIDAGNQPLRVADCGGVHIVLTKLVRDNNVERRKSHGSGTANTRVYHKAGCILHNHSLGADCGKNLTDTASCDNNLLAKNAASIKAYRAEFLILSVFKAGDKLINLGIHCPDNTNIKCLVHIYPFVNLCLLFVFYPLTRVKLLRIGEVVFLCRKDGKVAGALCLCRIKREVFVVAALDTGGTGYITLMRNNFRKNVLYDGKDFLILRIADKKVKSRLASHGAKVNHALTNRGGADVGRKKMLHGVHCDIVHIVACIRDAGTHIVRGHVTVNAGYINPLGNLIVVDREGCNFP